MHGSHGNSLRSLPLFVGLLLLSRPSAAQQIPAAPPGIQLPGNQLPGNPLPGFPLPGGQLPPGVVVPASPLSLEPGATVYVAVDSLPMFDGVQLLPQRFRRGTELKIAEVQRNSGSLFAVEIEYGQGDARRFGYVSRLGLSNEKPAAAAPNPKEPDPKRPKPKLPAAAKQVAKPADSAGAADNAAPDAKRIEGVWAVAGMSVMGRLNPGSTDVVPMQEIAAISPAGIPQANAPAGFPMYMLAPLSEYYQFKGGRLMSWSQINVANNAGGAMVQSFGSPERPYRLDPKKSPHRMDVPMFDAKIRDIPTSYGIYEWQDDVLVWAAPTSIGGVHGANMPFPRQAEQLRPQGFDADKLRRSTVLYLMRVDPKNVTVPKAPVGTPAQNQGGNAF